MAESKDESVIITDDEKKAIDKDIAEAKAALVSKDTQDQIAKAKNEAKAEAEKEFQLKKQLEDAEKAKQELQAKIAAQEKETAERLSKLQSKVDELVTSKASINVVDPFKNQPKEALKQQVDGWSEEQVEEFQEASAREFFGDAYDARE